MRESQQQPLHDPEATLVVSGEETTLVSPRFDDEETLVARPVVPLENGAHVPAPEAPQVAPPVPDSRSSHAPRRSRLFALVLVSVLVGGVLGGAGLYLYQRQSDDPAVSPAATTQPDIQADAPQAPIAPAAEAQPAPSPETETPSTEATTAAAPVAEEPAAPDAEVPAAPVREPENVPAVERREAPAADEEKGTPKRGKKGSRDEEIERRPAPRPANDAPEARRVDSIFDRPRRAERRAERRAARRARRAANDSPDRLRRIFEGDPQ